MGLLLSDLESSAGYMLEKFHSPTDGKFSSGEKLSFSKSLQFSMFISNVCKYLFEDSIDVTISCFQERPGKTLQNVATQVPCGSPMIQHLHFAWNTLCRKG